MSPSDFATANIDEIVDKLTTDEAILLTAGSGFWYTHSINRLGVPAIKVSDGPNGVRGGHFFMGTPAKCLPSSTAMGATWDSELIQTVGRELLAEESKLRAASVILGPTCNIQRNPLGGRSFESFSEDPHLSGIITAAYINGVQSGGIGTTVKHYVGNDKEDDRLGSDSIMSDRALREVYLMPFMLAQKHSEPWSFMTGYNRVNGTHVSENPFLLKDVLRKEWGFDGMIMSDWMGVYSVDLPISAGLDLEMPGTGKWRTLDLMQRSIASRKLTLRTIKERARKVLELVKRCAIECPEVLDNGDVERSVTTDKSTALMRRAAAESIVLLKNEENFLPLNAKEMKKVAIVGGNAKAIVLSGGGSAALKPSYFITPFDGIVDAFGEDVEVTYCEGARTFKVMPTLDYEMVTDKGEPGWVGEWYAHESDDSMVPVSAPMKTQVIDETRIFISLSAPEGITSRWTMKLRGFLKPRAADCTFEFGMEVAGRAKLWMDGQLIIDNWTRQRRGNSFFAMGSIEERAIVHLKADTKHEIYVEFCNVRGPADDDPDEMLLPSGAAVALGGALVEDPDDLIDRAVELAKAADVVIAVVGLNADWESEGYDRKDLSLPGRTDELISKVAAVNSRTVVVTQAGSAIILPWADKVAAVVHAWYLGNATGDAIADVLFGKHNPSAKLSLTFPNAEADVPSFGHFHGDNGKVRYAEELFVGYKHYIHRNIQPAFAFGHGLSYTTFSLTNLSVVKPLFADKEVEIAISLDITNTGSVQGSQVVQLYMSLPATSALTHPPLQLKGFTKVRDLSPGQTVQVVIKLDKYAVSYWHELINAWVVEKGEYEVHVGTSSDDLPLTAKVLLGSSFEWNGL